MTSSFHKGQRLCERFVLLESLYVGEHDAVWQALDEQRATQVAIKCVARSDPLAESLWQSMLTQYGLRLTLDHDRLLVLFEPVRDAQYCVLPMQLAAGNTTRLRGKSYRQWRAVAIDVARALAHMHVRGCVHGDLKPTNVLLDFRGDALLGDFDTTRRVGERAPAGSPFSASPQQLRGNPAGLEDDLYGLGALLHEWMTGYPPHFPQRPDPADWPTLPPLQCATATPEHLQRLVRDLLAVDPTARGTNMEAVIECLERDDDGERQVVRDGAEIFDITQVISAPGGRSPESPIDSPTSNRRPTVLWLALAVAIIVTGGVWWGLPKLTEIQSTELARVFAAAREASQLDRSSDATRGDGRSLQSDSAEATPAQRFAALEADYLQQLNNLESRAAGVWGGESFAGGKSLGKLARDAADDRDWELALDRISVATRRLERVEELASSVKATRLAEAGKAVDSGQLELARQNFELVRQLDPTDEAAAEGLERVSALLAVLPVLADAETALLAGDALRALTLYEQVLRADGRNDTATRGLQQAKRALGDDLYGQTIGQALAELREGEFGAAEATLSRAAELNPNANEIAAVRAQLAAARERRALDGERDTVLALERAERWSEALASYEQILARDSSLVFAQRGRERVAPRARAEQRLNALLSDPTRLSSPEVRGEAQRLLTLTATWTQQMTLPVLTRQREALRAQLDRYGARMRAIIESDGLTEIRIQRVGVLGAFERKELELQPGRYVAIGTRPGFRDVRREFSLVPGETSPIIDVRCTETIT